MLRLVFTLALNLLLVLLWPIFAMRRRRAAQTGAFLTIDVDGPVVEIARRSIWRRKIHALNLNALRRALTLAAGDPRVSGVVVTIRELRAGSATATSLRELLAELRRAHKRVVVYLPHGGGNVEYYVASVADRLLLGPHAHLAPAGFAIQAPYLKQALEKVGIRPEIIAQGRFKAAGETLIRQSMSEAQREQVGEFLSLAYQELLEAIAEGRGVAKERAVEWIERGLWTSESALEAGLCDALCYPDELETKVTDGVRARLIGAPAYARRRSFGFRPLVRAPRIAVIEVKGPIVSKAPGAFPVAAEPEVCRAIRKVLEDRRYQAAVVYIDSRGGSAIASDRILRELKRLSEKKPTVACLGDVAASGGYMIAVGARRIVAQPLSLTGSIGVVMARFDVGDMLARFGIAVEVVKRGGRADMLSPARSLADDERELLSQYVRQTYDRFLHVVADGRNRPVEQIEELAQGRIYAGRHAADAGLVDQLGGFDAALEVARQLCQRKLEPEVVAPATRAGLRSVVGQWLGHTAATTSTWAFLDLASLYLLASQERVWALCPHEFGLNLR